MIESGWSSRRSRIWASVPTAAIRPWAMTATWSVIFSSSSSSWLLTSRHLPRPTRSLEKSRRSGRPIGIDAAQGLVQDQQFRIVQQALGQLDGLAHALGIAARAALGPVGHADEIESIFGSPPRAVARVAAQPGHGRDELAAGQVLVERVNIWTVPDVSLGRRLRRRTIADDDAAQVGAQVAGRQAHQGGLAAPLEPTRPVMPGRSSRVTWLTPMTGPVPLGDALEKQHRRRGRRVAQAQRPGRGRNPPASAHYFNSPGCADSDRSGIPATSLPEPGPRSAPRAGCRDMQVAGDPCPKGRCPRCSCRSTGRAAAS